MEPGLYLGDLGSSYNIPILTDNGISAIVSLSDAKSAVWSFPRNRALVSEDRHIFIPCLDSSTQDLLVEMANMCDFIESKRECVGESQRNVLVHCTFGASRSATVVVAYLMRKYQKPLAEVLAAVREKRRVKPNSNFMEQLAVWEETGYEIWDDVDHSKPKAPYAEYLTCRAARLAEKGLTGNEPVCPDLWDKN